MARASQRFLILLWSCTFGAMALGSMVAYGEPLYWLSGVLLWGSGFFTLLVQAPHLALTRSARVTWLRYLVGVGALGVAFCYFATSLAFFTGWFMGLFSVLLLIIPQRRTGRLALLMTTVGLVVLPWGVLCHTSLLPSIAAGNQAHLRVLLTCGADVNELRQHDTPLIAAVRLGRADLVEMLLRHGADPNGRSSAFMNATPVLFDAARLPAEKHRVLQLLLEYGADSNLTNGS
ncbi:ankyrin repeat domain-containing protein [Hymenobacter sp. GOD-10R]|uniref:ankyrin repeat domain-containing protein n=1 Tax=Hymenobacter sp. GOD-10R TaxID=3093922 RepID=UPI002D776508|nr:ankyrin repeat domain-containing protein [Hymenobacter sp. GOD-10R]WRQ31155.1 ankyrin repeat domain-containing protein [Hymenobacter sp. GOD-10R]